MPSAPVVPESYAQLQTLMGQYMKRQDLNNLIPSFISLAEEWFDDNVYTRARRDTYTFALLQNVVQLPSDWKRVIKAYYNGNNLDFMPMEFNSAYAKGNPNNIYNGYQIIGDNVSISVQDLGGICQIDYYTTLEPLSDTNTSNWLLEDSPNTYLFGSLYQAGIYMRDDARAQQWMMLRDMAIQSKVDADERAKSVEAPLTIRAG
jgi:hypothetical protein